MAAQKHPERRVARKATKLYESGDYVGAETDYRRALEINPALREAGFNLGNALWRQEKPQDAAKAWESIAADSLAPAPLVSAASYNIGNAALAGQQIDAAIEAYKAALRLRPDDAEAKYNLAYAQKLREKQNQQQDQNDKKNQDDSEIQNDSQDQNDSGDQKDGQDDPKDGQGDPQDGQGDPQDGQGDPPPPSEQERSEGQGRPKMDPRAVEQMLDAMQAAEDDTREKVNTREVQVGARDGKNW